MRRLHYFLTFIFLFYTIAGISQAILQETFESGIPVEWSVIDNNDDATTWLGYSSSGYTDTYSASIQEWSTHDDYLVTPEFTVEDGMKLQFVAKSHSTSWLEDMEVLAAKGADTAEAFTIQLGDYPAIPGTWTTYEIDLTANANLTVGDAIYVAFRCYSSNAYYIYLDDVLIEAPSDNDLSVNDITFNPNTIFDGDNTDITATIENKGLNDQLGVVVDFQVDGSSIGTETIDLASGNTTDVTLSWSATQGAHDVTVEVPSDDNTSNDALTESITVHSAAAMFEDFEGTFPPSGWSGDISSSEWKQYDLDPYEGTYSAYVSAGSLKRFVTPKLVIDGTSTISFYAKASYGTHDIKLAYSSDQTTWTDVPSGTISLNDSYAHYTVDLSAIDIKGNYFIAFVYNLSYTGVYIDNVVGPEIAAEAPTAAVNPTPADAATGIVADTDLTWEDGAGGVPTGYKVYFGTDGDGSTTPTNIENGTEQTERVYSPATALEYETTYYWQIIPTNSVGDAPSCPIWSFTTQSNPTQTIPYSEDFEAVAENTLPDNWSSDFTYQVLNNHGVAGGKAMAVNMWSNTSTAQATTMPIGPLSTTANQVVFDYRIVDYSGYPATATDLGASDKVELQVSTDGGANFTTVQTIDQGSHTTTTDFTTITHNLDAAYNGETVLVRFQNTWGSGDYFVDIDNVKVREMATDPVFLADADTLTFMDVPVTMQKIQTLNIMNDGGGTLQINDGDIAISGTHAADFSFESLTFPVELAAGESIDIDVMFNAASAGDAEASLDITHNGTKNLASIALLGSAYDAFPTYFENFDATTEDEMPAKWQTIVDGAGVIGVTESTSDSYSQPNYLMITNNAQQTGNVMAVTPAFEMGNKRLVFYAKHGFNTTAMSVGTLADPADPSTFNHIQDITLTGSYQEFEIDFSGYAGSDMFVALKHNLDNSFSTVYVDDLNWEEIPTTPVCVVNPTSLDWGMSTVGQVSAEILTVTNAGVGTLTINSNDITFNGDHAADFSLGDATFPIELAEDASADLTINFVAQSGGTRSATLSIAHNGNNSPVDVPLTGEGVDGMIEDFNNVGTTFPPEGWTADEAWKALTFSTYEGDGGVWFNPSEEVTEAKLITPLLEVQSGDTFSFYAKKSSNDATLKVMHTDDTASGTWNEISSFTVTNTDYEQKIVDLSSVPEGEQFFAIAGSGLAFTSTYVDYVQGPSLAGTYDITFIVTDQTTGDLMEGATITVGGNEYITNTSGEAIAQLSNGTHNYEVTTAGYEIYNGSVTVNGANQTVNVAMTPIDGYTVTFNINDEDGNPIEGAAISIDGNDLLTDASGIADIVLANGEYEYTVTADGHAPVTDTVTVSDQDVNITEYLLNVYELTFNVTDEGGNPINGAFVVIGSNFYSTDASGQVTVNAVNGTYFYTVTKADYEMLSDTVTVDGADVTENVTLRLVYFVYFEVSDPTGNPIEDAEITIEDSTLTTNVDGLAVLELPNGSYEAIISKTGYEDANEPFNVNGAEVDVPVTLYPLATAFNIYFNVVDNDDQSIEGATIELTDGTDTWTQTSDVSGEATFADMPNGTYDYTVLKTDYEDATGSVLVDNDDVAEVVVMDYVGLNSLSESKFNLYPNPTEGVITIECGVQESVITVLNSMGEVLKVRKTSQKTSLDLSGYGKGIFLIRIEVNGQYFVKRIIVK